MNSISRALEKARSEAAKKANPQRPQPGLPAVREMRPAPPSAIETSLTPAPPRVDSRVVVSPPAGALPIDPRDYLYMALKHRWLILAVLLIGIAATAFFTMRQVPEYQTHAVLQLSQERIRVGSEFIDRDRVDSDEFFSTHIRLLESPAVAERVVNRLRLWEHPEWGTGAEPGSTPEPEVVEGYVGWIRKMLSAVHVSRTQLIEVYASSEIPELAALVANTAVREYIFFVTERESGVAKDAASLFQEQVERLQNQIASGKAALESYATADSQRTLSVQTLTELNRQLLEAEAQRSAAEARYGTISTAAPGMLPEVMSDPAVLASQQRLDELRAQHEALLSRFKSDWPEVKRLESSIAELEQRLERQKSEAAVRVAEQARSQVEEASKREASLRAALRQQEREIQRLDAALVEFDRRKLELDGQTLMLQNLLAKESEAGVRAEVEGRPPINARVVQEASVPRYPYKPNLRQNLIMGSMASLVLAFGLVFSLERFRTSITTVEDVRHHVPAQYLGMIPRYDWRHRAEVGADASRGSLLVGAPGMEIDLTDEQAQVVESFKFLRTMLASVASPSSKTFIITSPGKGSGKTFVASNLATSFAQSGARVLLVDADLRVPRLHKIFGCVNEEGVSAILEGEAYLDDSMFQQTAIPGLWLLPAGTASDRPSGIFHFERLDTALQRIMSKYDLVIIDSAPLLPVPDAMDLAAFCDEIVLTLRSGRVTRQAVDSSLDLLNRAGRKVTGVVLNDVNLSEIATLYYQTYRHGFGGYSYSRNDSSSGGLSKLIRGR